MKAFLLPMVTALVFSCSGENKTEAVNTPQETVAKSYSIVTTEEYESASVEEKALIDKINAAVVALDQLNDNSYSAIVAVSKDPNNAFSNAIIISKEEKDASAHKGEGGSCTVCGLRSAYACLQKLQEVEGDEFDVHVKRENGCVKLSW